MISSSSSSMSSNLAARIGSSMISKPHAAAAGSGGAAVGHPPAHEALPTRRRSLVRRRPETRSSAAAGTWSAAFARSAARRAAAALGTPLGWPGRGCAAAPTATASHPSPGRRASCKPPRLILSSGKSAAQRTRWPLTFVPLVVARSRSTSKPVGLHKDAMALRQARIRDHHVAALRAGRQPSRPAKSGSADRRYRAPARPSLTVHHPVKRPTQIRHAGCRSSATKHLRLARAKCYEITPSDFSRFRLTSQVSIGCIHQQLAVATRGLHAASAGAPWSRENIDADNDGSECLPREDHAAILDGSRTFVTDEGGAYGLCESGHDADCRFDIFVGRKGRRSIAARGARGAEVPG